MTTESYSKLIDAIDNQPLTEILLLTKDLITKTDIIKLKLWSKNEVANLKKRMLEQEKYPSKDTIINNLPLLENSDSKFSSLFHQTLFRKATSERRSLSLSFSGKVNGC